MIAIKRLQSIMWILIVAVGALSAYLISLRVATERHAVQSIEAQIYRTRANIRYLEVEFSARSSMRQLEAWNAQDIRYSVPDASQYLSSESQLAMLGRVTPDDKPYAGPPVMSAMARADTTPVKAVPRGGSSSDFSLIKAAVAAEPVAAHRVAMKSAIGGQTKPAAAPADARATRLAMLDAKLLDARTLRQVDSSDRGAAH